MTNEEKAIEIIGCEGRTNCLKCGGSLSVDNGCAVFQKIIKIAKWKDEQYEEKIKRIEQALIDVSCRYEELQMQLEDLNKK